MLKFSYLKPTQKECRKEQSSQKNLFGVALQSRRQYQKSLCNNRRRIPVPEGLISALTKMKVYTKERRVGARIKVVIVVKDGYCQKLLLNSDMRYWSPITTPVFIQFFNTVSASFPAKIAESINQL